MKTLLLILIFVINLWVPFYNHTTPTLFGFPFFYWYQMVAVPISALLLYIALRLDTSEDEQ
ncbi:DUF3311 domain-containing protein [Acidimangrovimonas sediminis]|uniref:DUF3311 domain-containing protein n=1 Tax=Acidimangrovimonas sediminis TaxID=2056283 RepID=UPI001E347F7B|nr:DUF3311 domain-containing protein [Acidimangrovimonas sediminis]